MLAIAHHGSRSSPYAGTGLTSPSLPSQLSSPEPSQPDPFVGVLNYVEEQISPVNLGSPALSSLLLHDPASPALVASSPPLQLQCSNPLQELASGVGPANKISSSTDSAPGRESYEPLAYESDDSGYRVGNMYPGIVVPDIDTDEEAFFMEDPQDRPYEEPEVETDPIDAGIRSSVPLGDTPITIDGPFVRPEIHDVSVQEIISLALHDMAVKCKGQRNYVDAQRELHATTGNKLQDYRTVRKRVTNITGLNEVRYDCCPNGCMSYSITDRMSHSPTNTCKHSRWKDPGPQLCRGNVVTYCGISGTLDL